MKLRRWFQVVFTGACLLGLAGAADATVIQYAATGTSQSQPVSATATITTGTNSLSIVLTNLESNPTSISQSISGIELNLSSTPTSAALSSATGSLIDLSGGVAVPVSGSISHWSAALSGGAVYLATAGTGAPGGQPIDLIIGPAPYTNANSSFGSHQPHIQTTATFNLTVPGITSTTVVTAAAIEFGTTPDAIVSAVKTPEPMSLLLLASGVVGLGLVRRRLRAA